MLCDKCKKNIASNFFTKNINGQITEYHLCNACAQKFTNVNFFLDELLGSFMSSSNNSPNLKTGQQKCTKCGVTFDDIIKTGKVGCDNCYTQFREMLIPSIKKLHTNTKHIGSSPSSATTSSTASSKISMLKSKLEIAIKNQDFEHAAQLRDQINELKKVGEDKHEQQK